MTLFDYALLGVLLASMAIGAWRGVIGEVIALVAWVLAFFAAKWFGPEFAAQLLTGIGDPVVRLVAAWVSIFVIVLMLMALLRLAIRGLLKALGLGWSDRALGVVFGVARGVLIVLALVALGGILSLTKEKWWSEAVFAAPLETAVLACKPWLPPEVAKRIRFR